MFREVHLRLFSNKFSRPLTAILAITLLMSHLPLFMSRRSMFVPSECLPPLEAHLHTPEHSESLIFMRSFGDDDLVRSSTEEGLVFVRGELLVTGELWATYDAMSAAIAELGGEIVGFLELANVFQVYFPHAHDEQILAEILEALSIHPLVYDTCKHFVFSTNMSSVPTSAPPRRIGPIFGSLFRPFDIFNRDRAPRRPANLDNQQQWGMIAINAPAAWPHADTLGSISIGILDTFFEDHHHLGDESRPFTLFGNNVAEGESVFTRQHGNQVAGIIGSLNPDRPGLVWNRRLYGYSLYGSRVSDNVTHLGQGHYLSVLQYKHALASLFAHDVRLINVSIYHPYCIEMGLNRPPTWHTLSNSLANFLHRYLSMGQEFLIVQAAGNSSNREVYGTRGQWIDASYASFFASIDNDTHPEIHDRIIVVGNMMRLSGLVPVFYGISGRSQIGPRVDMFAPGDTNVSTTLNNGYNWFAGTAASAPHVTGVAAMVWAENSTLTGSQVRDILRQNYNQRFGHIYLTEPGFSPTPDGRSYPVLDAYRALQAARATSPC